ncbi:hypothetical protein AAEU29_20350 [Pseudoalteromonas sp. SSM20]|uniref:hypothetical protein n=1 Tax=Pseudoalteromonas sp. SSM20 TaxID=3139394 RepID=UPI003BA96F13
MKHLVILILLVIVTGCAKAPKQFGDFTTNNAVNNSYIANFLAKDVINQIDILYPSAKTTLYFKHETADKFGTALVKNMREFGYGVTEFSTPEDDLENTTTPSGLSVAYIIDHLSDKQIIITIFVNQKPISRLYDTSQENVRPLGEWAYLAS